MFLNRIFRSRPDRDAGFLIYGAIVAQSRQPSFFRDLGVEDSFEGRFEMLVLHVYMVLNRLKREEQAGDEVGQALFDTFFADLDTSMRELGVGDLSIAKKVKALASAFYGRVGSYDEAIRSNDRNGLSQALVRNVFGDNEASAGSAGVLSAYVFDSLESLKTVEFSALLRGELEFAPVG